MLPMVPSYDRTARDGAAYPDFFGRKSTQLLEAQSDTESAISNDDRTWLCDYYVLVTHPVRRAARMAPVKET